MVISWQSILFTSTLKLFLNIPYCFSFLQSPHHSKLLWMSSKDCISWSVFPWTNIKLDIIRCKWCHLYDMYCLSVCLRQLTLFSGTNTCGMSSTKAWLDFQGTETFLTLASRDSLMYCTRIVFFYVNTILRVIFLDRVSFF